MSFMVTSVLALFANSFGRGILSAKSILLNDTLITYRREGGDRLERGCQNGCVGRDEVTNADRNAHKRDHHAVPSCVHRRRHSGLQLAGTDRQRADALVVRPKSALPFHLAAIVSGTTTTLCAVPLTLRVKTIVA